MTVKKIVITDAARERLAALIDGKTLVPGAARLANGDWVIEVDDEVYAELHRRAVAGGISLSQVILETL